MRLKAVVDSLDEVDEKYHDLYIERNGRFEIQVEGMKTPADVERVMISLTKEREEHKKTKEKLQAFGGLDPEEVLQKLDRFEELEAAAAGKIDDSKLNEIVEARLRSKLAPVERERAKLLEENQSLQSKVEQYQAKERQRTIHDAVRQAAMKVKVVDTAIEDALLLAERVFEIDDSGAIVTKDGVGVTPGVAPEVWFTDMQHRRPHWWGPSQGLNSRGNNGSGGGNNPWTAEHWNLTEQGRIVRENRTKAEQMAKAAGTRIGGPKPAAK